MTAARINKAIKHLNLEIVRGNGYCWFADLTHGGQVGESVMVCYLKHQTLEQWVEDAKYAYDSEQLVISRKDIHPVCKC